METVMVRGRYKIVRVLEAGDDYAFAEAVDITERETPVRLLNIYEGAWLPIYARLFSEIKDCPAFCEAFLAEESLTAVFRPCGGVPIDRFFYRGADWSWRDRLAFAEQLLHQALLLADLPPAVGCAALLADNVRVDAGEKRIALRFRIHPMEEMNASWHCWPPTTRVRYWRPASGRGTRSARSAAGWNGGISRPSFRCTQAGIGRWRILLWNTRRSIKKMRSSAGLRSCGKT